ncbi:MAG: DUF116 domain-containing protein [Candidatus Cloacimonetes bacterium]|nr:DUF116 domain-containing protein [Candidatus Cloacimonadota bacterium]
MEYNIDTKGKGLFLFLSTITLIMMMAVTTLLWWFVSPRLHEISEILANLSLTFLRIFYFVLILGTILVYLTCFLEKNFLVAKFAVHAFIKILFPVTLYFGRLIGLSKDRIRESFVFLNNSFIKALRRKFRSSDILLLLPHCLQDTRCGLRITVNIFNCQECKKCDIARLISLAKKHGISIAIATGGTLARKIIVENKPKLIIAVACERDLVEGLREVFPIPVYGILNERPEGPCINTRVATDKIELVLNSLLE